MQLWPPSQIFLVRTLKTFARIPVRMKKLCAFQKIYSLKCSSEQAQWNLCEPAVTLSARRRKTLANFKRDEDTFFWTKLFFFHQECFCSKRECIFKNASKKSSPKTHRFAAQIPKTTKKFMNLSKGKYLYSKCSYVHVECSFDNPAEVFSTKLWKLFAGIPKMMESW